MIQIEEWKDVNGYEEYYQVSNFGRVKGLNRYKKARNGSISKTKERIMAQTTTKKGYLKCKLSKENISKNIPVHRLVATSFLENIQNKPQINHIDGNKKNNNLNNLEWCTGKENVKHAIDKVLRKKIPKAIITMENAREIRKSNLSYFELIKIYGITKATIYDIKTNRTWKESCWSRTLD